MKKVVKNKTKVKLKISKAFGILCIAIGLIFIIINAIDYFIGTKNSQSSVFIMGIIFFIIGLIILKKSKV